MDAPAVSAMLPESTAAGTPLSLIAARPFEPLVRARGTTFLVTNREGNIAPAGARELGLFAHDTRFLSYYELTIDGAEVAYLSAEATGDSINQVDLMLGGAEAADYLDDPEHYVHIRRRQLVDDEFVEELTLTNYLRRELQLDVVYRFESDFADVFEVRGAHRPKRGELGAPRLSETDVELSYAGLDGRELTARLSFRPAPRALSANEARYTIVLGPGQRTVIEILFSVSCGEARPRERSAFATRRAQLDEEARAFKATCAKFSTDNGLLSHCLARSQSDLFALRINLGRHAVLGAGIPWFCAPFGRDALFTAYETLLLNPELAVTTLRALAAYQGDSDDPFTEEEPGKILHELRFGEMARAGETPHTPYYGSVDATPLFVVVLHATYEVLGDTSLLEELRPALLGALAWIDRQARSGEAFVTYQRRSPRGLDNQGWKDSKNGIVFGDGRRPVPPIALVEVQGYCADAYRRGAALLAALGDPEGAQRYAGRAGRLAEKIERDLWLPDVGRYAFAIDGTGAKLDTVVSNAGHLLWSGVVSEERALSTSKVLLDPQSFSGYGVRTLAAGQPAYNPLSYHEGTVWPHDNAIIAAGMAHYGLHAGAKQIFEGLLGALEAFRDHRLPELFCGMERASGSLARYPVACSPQAWAAAAPYLLIQSVLGIAIDAPARRLCVRDPCLPQGINQITLEGLRVGAARVSLRVKREAGRVHVDVLDVSGGDVRTSIELT